MYEPHLLQHPRLPTLGTEACSVGRSCRKRRSTNHSFRGQFKAEATYHGTYLPASVPSMMEGTVRLL